MKNRMNRKRKWGCGYKCTGCGSWHYSKLETDACCKKGAIELNVCSWCWRDKDNCECEVPEDMEA